MTRRMCYPLFLGHLKFLDFDPYFLAKYTFHGHEVIFFLKGTIKMYFDKSLGGPLLRLGENMPKNI